MSDVVIERSRRVVANNRTMLSWAAVLGGLFVAIATSWLLALLGAAIGVSIADASDAEAVGAGLGIASTIWLLLTFLIAYFVGGLVAGRLSGSDNDDDGVLHGITMWGVSIVLTALVGFSGLQGLVQTGASAAGALGSGSARLISSIDVDSDALDQITNTAAFDRIRAAAVSTARNSAANAAARNSAVLSQSEANLAIRQIEDETLIDMGVAIINGAPERARDILAAETTLSDGQIQAVVQNVEQEARIEIQQLKANAEEAAEAASTYATATLWALFIAVALALVAAIVGGFMGTSTVRRINTIEQR